MPKALLFILFFALPTFAWAERKAFIVGNSDYQNIPDLVTTANDVGQYQTVLTGMGFQTELRNDLSADAFLDAFETFLSTIKSGDTVVFVYSGHGWSDGSLNYVIPTDAPNSGSDRTLRRATFPLRNGVDGLVDEIHNAGAGLVVAVIDACRDNPFQPKPGTRSSAPRRGLVIEPAPPQGTFLIFSAGAGQQALDLLPGETRDQTLSVFSRNFLPHLASNAYLEDAIAEAQVATARLAATFDGHEQHPAYYDQTLGKTCLHTECKASSPPILPRQRPEVVEKAPTPVSKTPAQPRKKPGSGTFGTLSSK